MGRCVRVHQATRFRPFNPFGENPAEEAPSDDFTMPRKVHYHSIWKHDQDAVCWVKLSRAQDQGLRFWQTKSSAIIVHNLVPAKCIHKVISQNGDRTLRKTLNPSACAKGERFTPVTGNWMRLGLRIGMSKAIRQRMQVQLVPGNWGGILFHLLTKSQNSKSIFEWKEYLKMPSQKTKNR